MKLLQIILLCLVTSAAHALPLELFYTDTAGVSTPLQGATLTANRHVYVPAKISTVWGLRWNQNMAEVTGYRVHFGNDITTPTMIREVPNPATGAVVDTEFSVASLGLTEGQKGCFRLTAYNEVAESEYSRAVCGTHTPTTTIQYILDGAEVAAKSTAPMGFNFSIAGLTQGAHVMVASVTYGDGSKKSVSVDFSINAPAPIAPEGATVIKKYP